MVGPSKAELAEEVAAPALDRAAGRQRRVADGQLHPDEAGDVLLAIGTRLQDFTTGSHSMFGGAKLLTADTDDAKLTPPSVVA